MKMRLLACCAFFLNTLLFATYYAVAKEALDRIDPIIFTYFEMMALVPVALCIIVFCWQDLNKRIIKHGIIVGSSLCLALFTIAIALKYASATSTAFFPALNGFLAAFAAWLFLRQPISKGTWFAGLLSLVGTLLLIFNSPVGGMRGTLIAFLGGLFFTGYVFLSEHEQKEANAYWPLFGVELLTMALWANLIALLFGDWQAVHPILPKDVWVILYVAGACTFFTYAYHGTYAKLHFSSDGFIHLYSGAGTGRDYLSYLLARKPATGWLPRRHIDRRRSHCPGLDAGGAWATPAPLARTSDGRSGRVRLILNDAHLSRDLPEYLYHHSLRIGRLSTTLLADPLSCLGQPARAHAAGPAK